MQENPCDEVILPEKNECIKMNFQIVETKKFPETYGYFFTPYIPYHRIDFHFFSDPKIIPYNDNPKHHKEGL